MTANIEYIGSLGCKAEHLKSKSILFTDAPIDNNGKGQNFSPTDLVATALASCMLTVMAIAADKQGIEFQGVKASVKKHMRSAPRAIDEIEIVFEIEAKWSGEERKMIEEVGRNCPVALSLSKELKQTIKFKYLN